MPIVLHGRGVTPAGSVVHGLPVLASLVVVICLLGAPTGCTITLPIAPGGGGGCCGGGFPAPPPPPVPAAPSELIVLRPDLDGGVGVLSVANEEGDEMETSLTDRAETWLTHRMEAPVTHHRDTIARPLRRKQCEPRKKSL